MRGYTLDKDDYLLRLRKIEGQVRGLQRLVEDDTYCIGILTQIASVNAALHKVALGLVDQHLRHCVMDAMDTQPDWPSNASPTPPSPSNACSTREPPRRHGMAAVTIHAVPPSTTPSAPA